MAKKMECLECGGKFTKLYDDPRDPPLEVEVCLCKDCYSAALDEIATEAEALALDCRQEIERLDA